MMKILPRTYAVALLVISVLVTGLSLTGCSSPSVPQDRYYRINLETPASGAIVLNGVVEMDRFVAVGLAAGRAVVYTSDANAQVLQEYNYDFWHEPPAIMLRDALIDYLRGANVAKDIVTPDMRASADYLLSGRVHRLETSRGSSPKAVVELELGVSDAHTGAVLIVRSYRTDVPVSGASVEAAAMAVNKAVEDIFERFLNDLRGR